MQLQLQESDTVLTLPCRFPLHCVHPRPRRPPQTPYLRHHRHHIGSNLRRHNQLAKSWRQAPRPVHRRRLLPLLRFYHLFVLFWTCLMGLYVRNHANANSCSRQRFRHRNWQLARSYFLGADKSDRVGQNRVEVLLPVRGV